MRVHSSSRASTCGTPVRRWPPRHSCMPTTLVVLPTLLRASCSELLLVFASLVNMVLQQHEAANKGV